MTRVFTHLHDLPDLTLRLQFVQLHHGRPDWFIAPEETAVRRCNNNNNICKRPVSQSTNGTNWN